MGIASCFYNCFINWATADLLYSKHLQVFYGHSASYWKHSYHAYWNIAHLLDNLRKTFVTNTTSSLIQLWNDEWFHNHELLTWHLPYVSPKVPSPSLLFYSEGESCGRKSKAFGCWPQFRNEEAECKKSFWKRARSGWKRRNTHICNNLCPFTVDCNVKHIWAEPQSETYTHWPLH